MLGVKYIIPKSFIRHVSDRKLSDDEWFRRILLFLGRKPSDKWTDQDCETAKYRLSEFSGRMLDLEKLRLHDDKMSKQDAGLYEAILLKTVTKGDGEIDEVVSLNRHADAAIADARERINNIVTEVDDPQLALALVARLTSDFLAQYRRSHQSKGESGNEIRDVG